MTPAFAIAGRQRVDFVYTSTSAVPPARYVRWKLVPAGTLWDLTFRIWLSAYAWTQR